MEIKKLPQVGDVNFAMQVNQEDTLLVGYLIENEGDTIVLSNLSLDNEGCLNAKYEWVGHNVGYKVKVDEENNQLMAGSFMNFFDVTGTKM